MSRGRRLAILSAAAAALLLVAAIALFQISKARCFTLTGEIVCRVETDEPVVALTFDDGPTPEGVELTLSHLRREGVKATFFLIGSQIEQAPELVGRLAVKGHELGNHSYSHVRMVGRSFAFYDKEIGRTEALLRGMGAPPSGLFRPPYGKKLVGLPRAVAARGLRMVMIDVEEPIDAASPREYADRMVREARPGSILLMHVMYRGNGLAREALPLVLSGLRERGLRVVTVGELLRRQR
ncbi:polysaccharide deacetylase family protein [Sphingosinicella terrae]|uniref:polysaccharide deacetylase family protein n=1 Tax=Sphingosinicella terrae TaxID=2172047 RepID=UPI000E0E03D7|nr:polysaccharide deacetylase family protein [Sphingosinicella terrae]